MEAVAAAARDPAVLEGAAATGRDVDAGLGRGVDRAALDGGVGALGDDHTGLHAFQGAAVEGAAAAVVAEPGARRRLPDPAVVELCGGAVAHRHGRVAHLRQIAVDDVRAGAAVEDEQGVRHVVHPAGVQHGGGAVAHPHRRVVAGAVEDLALVGVHPRARVPHRQTVAAELPHAGAGQREHRTGPQVDRVLRDVVDPAVGERQHRVGVERDAVAGRAVHVAVGEVGGGALGHLDPAAPHLVDLAAHGLQRRVLPGRGQPRARRVVHPAALQPGVGAPAHRDAGLTRRDHLAVLEHPAPAVQYGDADARGIVDRAAVDRGTGAAAHLDAGRGPGDHAYVAQLRGALLDQHGRGGGVLALHVQVLHHRRGAHGQRDAVQGRDAHRSGRALGAAQRHRPLHHEVLPVGPGSDGEDVALGRGLQGGGERSVLTRAAPPPRCAGVRHLDRALCHGVAVPPPCRTWLVARVLPPIGSAGPP